MLKCPLCDDEMEYNEGSIDAGGGMRDAYVRCECGFTYTPNVPFVAFAGEDGWKPMYRQLDGQRAEINRKFAKASRS